MEKKQRPIEQQIRRAGNAYKRNKINDAEFTNRILVIFNRFLNPKK